MDWISLVLIKQDTHVAIDPIGNMGQSALLSRFTGQPESRSGLVFNVYVFTMQETI